jgi:hypothetical protein
MKTRRTGVIALAVSVCFATTAYANLVKPSPALDLVCIVADPTGTPLNVRTSPHGPIVSTFTNGLNVVIHDRQ